ncbi:MAG: hypothetical protein AB7Q29_06225, partial [Vicinamibacterales bacterium]
MTRTTKIALMSLLPLAIVSTVVLSAAGAGGAAGLAQPRLTAITSRLDARTTSVIIEASEPLPYVATRPDPLTLFVDFRHVNIQGSAAPTIDRSPRGPIASV